jgi:hypothetical protein
MRTEGTGRRLSRRAMLEGLSAAAVLGGTTSEGHARTTAEQGPTVGARSVRAALAYEDFIARCRALAKAAAFDTANEDAYLFEIAALAARLASVPVRPMGRFGTFDPPVEFAPLAIEPPLFVIQWRLAPGAVLPAHNHPSANVVTLGLEGECRIRNFEVEGGAPADFASPQAFRLRETHDELVTPGRVNALSSTRDNIHELRAGPAGARGVDIGTMVARQDAFAFVELAKQIDPERRVYEARWRKG